MSSPITLFAPLGALPDVGTPATRVPHTARESDTVAPPSRSAEVDWSGTPGPGAAHQPTDLHATDANAGIALAQTAGAALDRVTGALRGMRALASHAGTASPDERPALEQQFEALGAAVRRVLEETQADGRPIFGSGAGSTAFRVGADGAHRITVNTHDLLGHDALQAVTTGPQASLAEPRVVPPALAEHLGNVIAELDLAAAHVADERGALATAELRFDAALAEMLDAARDGAAHGRTLADAGSAASTAQALSGQIRQDPGAAVFALTSPAPLRVLGLLAPGSSIP